LIGRIQSRSAFQQIRAEGRHVRSGPLSCTMLLDSSLTEPLVGYALGCSYGSAVRRNRLRRQLRELMKTRESAIAPGIYVFGASPRAHGTSFEDLGRHLDGVLAKCAKGSVS
jgi:ribonuclease P protein component